MGDWHHTKVELGVLGHTHLSSIEVEVLQHLHLGDWHHTEVELGGLGHTHLSSIEVEVLQHLHLGNWHHTEVDLVDWVTHTFRRERRSCQFVPNYPGFGGKLIFFIIVLGTRNCV